ncbi:3-hydroxyacyl-CoA dehydrogenase NAD-binding domain-containing protein [Suttonella sp. R2A3]|uniref:3-hydroxyacyl-CoA dehydrogenase NAD-binding domain-containing protein n=1 Tax=Suttonella sp. R2A3 TaxID=2908648 RepID=UPI001F4070E0|nr:3-hydroxyacyl-CoA dehydrogenase NAD-binding domain-containing protein [Suttonella sp. R2A3]UJF24483.1 3-hydroxyacyl-CoA dehydrogenase NAD-binding domain-containing protein [Suttonella sp. R2A3]
MSESLTFEPSLQHWRLNADNEVLHLTLDRADSSTNSLNAEVLRELAQVINKLEQVASSYRGLLLKSGKDNGFIAGADISTIQETKSPEQLKALVKEVHDYFLRFERLALAKVALIDGFCLGGGLELALCCDYRVITKAAKLGVPEVKLGLHPGFAGTARLVRLLSPIKAMLLMLQGYNLRGAKALNAGLVDKVVADKAALEASGLSLIKKGPRQVSNWQSKVLSIGPVRKLLAKKIEDNVAGKVQKEHYPAPYAMIDLWREHGGSFQEMANAEIDSFVALRQTPQSDALIRLYFLQERLKGFAKNDAEKIGHLHVIGGGTMGGDIAAWSAMQGIFTTLSDLSEEQLEKAAKRAHKLFDKKLRDKDANREAKMRLRLDKDGWGLDKADLVIEAIVEKLEVKQSVFNDVLTKAKPEAIIATNTSSLKLEDIAAGISAPERLLGIHFFNPVAKMPLVEIVHQSANSQATLDKATKYVGEISRLPLPVKSSPGFLVNRVLVPYLFEALACLEEGVAKEAIDKAALDYGMPMGPIELADSVGLDVCQAIAGTMSAFIDYEGESQLDRLVAAGHLGRKSGKGFYEYVDGKAQKDAVSADQATLDKLQERMIMAFLNACAWCLREGVVEDEDLVDAGCVFGTGFAPFRGGPMNVARTIGHAEVVKRLEALVSEHGERFSPDPWWSDKA